MFVGRGKPWIIEVNEMPSFDTSAPIDLAVKTGVIGETLNMVCPTVQVSFTSEKQTTVQY